MLHLYLYEMILIESEQDAHTFGVFQLELVFKKMISTGVDSTLSEHPRIKDDIYWCGFNS